MEWAALYLLYYTLHHVLHRTQCPASQVCIVSHTAPRVLQHTLCGPLTSLLPQHCSDTLQQVHAWHVLQARSVT